MEIWDEKVGNNQDKKRKRNIFLVVVLALLITVPVIPVLLYRYGIENPAQKNNETIFEIKTGSSVNEISENLKDAGLINSPMLFKIYLKLNKLGTNIQAGVYVIPPTTSMKRLVDIIQFGRNDVSVRYIEGWRVEQLAELLVRKLKNIDYKEFVIKARPLEGHLFPDTYYLNIDIEQDELVELLQNTFDEKTEDILAVKNLKKVGLTKEEVVILASIVEREAAEYEDRRIIAGILIMRLREGMALEADATTQYAVALNKHCVPEECRNDEVKCDLDPSVAVCETGLEKKFLEEIEWWPKQLTRYDLEHNSFYNTRSVAGLPPAPISSISLSALESVIDYVPSDYYFYLTDAEGITHYSRDLEGHIQNMDAYLR